MNWWKMLLSSVYHLSVLAFLYATPTLGFKHFVSHWQLFWKAPTQAFSEIILWQRFFLLDVMTCDCQLASLHWHNVINENIVCCFVSSSIIPSGNGRINQHLVTFSGLKTSAWNILLAELNMLFSFKIYIFRVFWANNER